nr:unnamed protein product [Callosobruchus analis]
MAENCRTPEVLSFNGNTAASWKLWKQKFNLYLLASGKSNKADDIKIALLLNFLGDEGLMIYNTFEYASDEDRTLLQTVIQKFDEYCDPIKNEVFEHFKFFQRNQLPGESIDQFVTELKSLASTCEFGTLTDILIRDRIVLGVSDLRIQEKLLQTPNLKLPEAVLICRSLESSMATQKKISREQALAVQGIAKQKYFPGRAMSAPSRNSQQSTRADRGEGSNLQRYSTVKQSLAHGVGMNINQVNAWQSIDIVVDVT